MRKKIFITGAAGFIGFHLAKTLAKQGEQVIGYDNFNSYYNVKLKNDRADYLEKLGITVIKGDLCSFEQLQKSAEGATHIAHLAAQAGVRYSLKEPQAYVKSNLEGFLNILEICRGLKEIKLVYASSSSVYGLNSKVPFSESDPTDQQASLYGNTKKSNELMAASYHHLFGFPATGLRFFTVYGPWGRPDMAYYSFTRAILKGEPIEVFNHGKLLRDFTYIDDIVKGITAALSIDKGCEIYNLGNNQPVELLSFIEILEKSLGKKAILKMMPMQPGDVLATFADIDKSRKDLAFSPSTSLKEGIPLFVDWYKSYNS